MHGVDVIPGMGFVAAANISMNQAMIARATGYNASSQHFVLEAGAPYAKGSVEFAKSVYGLQGMLYNACAVPNEGGGSAAAGAPCSNVDGMLGPNTSAALRALPEANMSLDPKVLIDYANGGEVPQLGTAEISAAAAALGIRPKVVRRGNGVDIPDGGGEGNGVIVPTGPPKKDDGNMWLIVGGILVAGGLIYFMTKKKG